MSAIFAGRSPLRHLDKSDAPNRPNLHLTKCPGFVWKSTKVNGEEREWKQVCSHPECRRVLACNRPEPFGRHY